MKRTRAVLEEAPSEAGPNLSKNSKPRDPTRALNSTHCLLKSNPALPSAPGKVGGLINHSPSLEQANPRQNGRKAWVFTGLKAEEGSIDHHHGRDLDIVCTVIFD